MTETPEAASHKHTTHRRPFGTAEDAIIMKAMLAGPFEPWDAIASRLPGRTARQCRERWANYLSPAIRSDPWTPEEDRILIEKINEMGFSWSSIAHSFNGRSDNDIKNRWYSHLRYQTVNDGTKYVYAGTGVDSPYPERKRRNRLKICPKQSAFSLLEQQRACSFTHTVPMIVMPKPVREKQPANPPADVEDIWDRMMLEGEAENPFTFTFF